MIEELFNPNSVAIIGVSMKNESGWGNQILRNLINAGFMGDILPVNPRGGNLEGLVVYKSLYDAANVSLIKMVVIAVPAQFVADILEDCGLLGIKAVIIISAGFSELGNHELEEELVKIAFEYNISLVGPNTFGVQSRNGKLNVSLIGEL